MPAKEWKKNLAEQNVTPGIFVPTKDLPTLPGQVLGLRGGEGFYFGYGRSNASGRLVEKGDACRRRQQGFSRLVSLARPSRSTPG